MIKEFKTDVLKDKFLENIDKICLIIIYIKMPLIIEGKVIKDTLKDIIRRKWYELWTTKRNA